MRLRFLTVSMVRDEGESAEELRAPTDVVDLSGEDDAPAEGEPAAEEPAEGEPAAGDDAPEPGDTAMNETD